MSNTLRLLLAEGDLSDAEMVKRLLSKATHSQFQIEWTDTLEGAALALSASRFDGMLLDLGLPGTQGLEGLVKILSVDPRVPVIIVTDQNDEELALRALQVGAQDYLVKGSLTTDNLVRSIRYATERHALVRRLTDARIVLENRHRRLAKLYRTAYKFVDNVSHEFRTPLTVIKEYVSLIKDGIVGEVSDEQRRMLAIVEDRADDLNTMVDDMLDVSKLEAGILGVYRKRCQATDILARVRPALERKAFTKGVRLESDVEANLPPIYCDPEKAGRVLVNLAINAVKFCGQPGRVRLSCRRSRNPPGVEFSVSDNGPGISAENQRLLFRRFKQLSETVRSGAKGFGLGLSIAKELVEANLGEIRLDSEPGRGSTFSFTLPLDDCQEVVRRYLHRVGKLRNGPPQLSLVRAEVDPSTAAPLAEDVDGFLSCLLRYNDLVLRVGPSRWLVVLPVPEDQVAAFLRRAEKAFAEAARNRVGDPYPRIDFRHLGTWPVDHDKAILAEMSDIARCEEAVDV
ncbi:MAG TPA: hybrid sensor histidine kinase/response regulator [Pirellulales bacterium]|nr:hybrid sensor histidine kinase/response regulator [Pirellulales bacterium]